MHTILIVEKSGIIKETTLKTWVEKDLYKKAGFKVADGFEKAHQWTIDNTTVNLYGKTTGRAGQENKYDFPPPVDTTLFFGACILTVENGSLKKSEWEIIYETLFGGFEDIGDEDSEEDSDDDDDDDLPRTKDGYVKDGFIVDDDEDEDPESESESEPESDSDEPPPVKKQTKRETKKSKKTVFAKIDTLVLTPELENTFLDCTSELEEEEYE